MDGCPSAPTVPCRGGAARPILPAMSSSSGVSDTERGTPARARRTRWIVGLIVATLVVVGTVLMMNIRGSSQPDTAPPSSPAPVIAVLPLIDLAAVSDDYFNDGLAAEIAAGLAAVAGMEVRGRVSAGAYRDVNRDAGRVGAELGVSVVLDATVRRAGGRLRVAARLVDTRSGEVVWTAVQDTAMTAWFAARDEIVGGVARALGLEAGDETRRRLERRRTGVDALDLYALGRFGWAEQESGDLLEAVAFYQLAIEADSTFAPSWIALAEAYSLLPRFTRFPVENVREEGAAAARTALRLDPDAADAHAVLGEILYLYERDVPGGRSHLMRAIELDPGNGEALARLCELEMYDGRLDEAEAACRRGAMMEPLSFRISWLQADLLKLNGDLEGALLRLDSLRYLSPGYAPLAADVAFTGLLAADSTRAFDDLSYWIALLGGDDTLAAEWFSGGRSIALRRLAEEVDPAPSDLAALAALAGDNPMALAAVRAALRDRDPGSLRFGVYPEYETLREQNAFRILWEAALRESAPAR